LPGTQIQLAIRVPGVRKPVGLELALAPGMRVVPGPSGSALRAIEERANLVLGELDVAFITPGLIMDRTGVLLEAARRCAETLVSPPRAGCLLEMKEIDLPMGGAYRVDTRLDRGADGLAPSLPYQSVIVVGHPDLMLPLALVITLLARDMDWPAGDEVLGTVRFLGVPAAGATPAVALPFTY
jgi:hypothetical protein